MLVITETKIRRLVKLQIFSSDNVSGGGVYWMFYSGSTFETGRAPRGLHGLEADTEVEGLR
jgi:hypothetical protein